ncbi:iron-containing alcohol dehydrogenase [Bosea sp. (in: a-proteobacteria)]|uniref:iron-containing alcohol dehydrogenase n=1 Tax=Bosea sp. (in: a-proteobacteria) TaxID=1871050 RepID=UPI0025C1CBCA|nr:iron-containing alcohol dehydrogenase [Bosea sp. (in: a-proteobacteria)]MBR3193126.1 iron-containing alcohol dehydrogenase [Bosea sp. (in: a-proteobacteria)]
MTLKANWNYPTAVRFGPGRIAELAQACRAAGIERPLLVTDSGLSGLPMIRDAMAQLAADGLKVTLFDRVQANPVAANVEDGLKVLRDSGSDGVIAFGGGSALDCGKVVAFMAGQSRPMWDFEDIGDWWTRADPSGIAPIIAVPTTAGTGSEVGRAGVITDETTQTKKVIFHPKMMPQIVICDPELTVGLPAKVTVGAGMDALAHCLEAYCAPGFHPLADGIAVEGIRLCKVFLPRAVADGTDIEARAQMMAAAAMGATAFQKGLGAIHALSHPIGSVHHTHHGMTNAVFMPYVLTFNRPAIEEKIARLAAYIGLEPSFEAFFDWIVTLRRELGVPETLKAFGVTGIDYGRLAKMAIVDPTAGGNPVPLTEAAAEALFREATG